VDFVKQEPVQADDRDTLRQLLAEREFAGIIFTTAQKFALLNNENFIINRPIIRPKSLRIMPRKNNKNDLK